MLHAARAHPSKLLNMGGLGAAEQTMMTLD